jgi:hypothetical protein
MIFMMLQRCDWESSPDASNVKLFPPKGGNGRVLMPIKLACVKQPESIKPIGVPIIPVKRPRKRYVHIVVI